MWEWSLRGSRGAQGAGQSRPDPALGHAWRYNLSLLKFGPHLSEREPKARLGRFECLWFRDYLFKLLLESSNMCWTTRPDWLNRWGCSFVQTIARKLKHVLNNPARLPKWVVSGSTLMAVSSFGRIRAYVFIVGPKLDLYQLGSTQAMNNPKREDSEYKQIKLTVEVPWGTEGSFLFCFFFFNSCFLPRPHPSLPTGPIFKT